MRNFQKSLVRGRVRQRCNQSWLGGMQRQEGCRHSGCLKGQVPSIVSFHGDTSLSSIGWIRLSVPAHVPPLPIISSRPVCTGESMIHLPPRVILVAPLWRGGSTGGLRGFSSGRTDFVYTNKNTEKFSSHFLQNINFILLEVSIFLLK